MEKEGEGGAAESRDCSRVRVRMRRERCFACGALFPPMSRLSCSIPSRSVLVLSSARREPSNRQALTAQSYAHTSYRIALPPTTATSLPTECHSPPYRTSYHITRYLPHLTPYDAIPPAPPVATHHATRAPPSPIPVSLPPFHPPCLPFLLSSSSARFFCASIDLAI